MENIIVVSFEVESEAYQAFSELKARAFSDSYIISQAALAKNENGMIRPLDWFSVGAKANDDAILGGALGALFGVVGGPVGILLMGSYGALVGSTVDMVDADQNASMMEHVMKCVTEDKAVLIAMVQEEEGSDFDANFAKYPSEVTRFDAVEIAVEVEEAQRAEAELAIQARKQAFQEKKDARLEKLQARRAEIAAEFEDLKKDIKELREL